MASVRAEIGAERFDGGRFTDAIGVFERLIFSPTFEEFLTLPAYELLSAELRRPAWPTRFRNPQPTDSPASCARTPQRMSTDCAGTVSDRPHARPAWRRSALGAPPLS
jgi:hypothetical protein